MHALGAGRRRPGYASLGDSDAEVEQGEGEQGDAEQGEAAGGGGARRRRRRRPRPPPLPGEGAGDYLELLEVGRQASAQVVGALRGRGRAVGGALALCCAAALLAAFVALSFCRLPPLYHGLDYSWRARALGDAHSEAGLHWLGLLHRLAAWPDARLGGGRAWLLCLLRARLVALGSLTAPRREAGPLSTQSWPRVLEIAASEAAESPLAF